MNFIDSNQQKVQFSINRWYQTPGHRDVKVLALPKKMHIDELRILSSILLHFSQNDLYQRIHSEFKLLDRIYVQSRFQIRSFHFLKTLRKLRQTLKKFFSLSIKEVCETTASTKLSSSGLITLESFCSLQWIFLSCYELLKEITTESHKLAELLTQEMSTNVFLHFPIVFISLCSTISELSSEYTKSVFETFCRLRTIDEKKLIPFPKSDDDFPMPQLPWDKSLETKIEGMTGVAMTAITQKPQIAKIDFSITAKPNIQLRGKTTSLMKKPKSSLDSLDF